VSRSTSGAAGIVIFCEAAAFRETGGFSESCTRAKRSTCPALEAPRSPRVANHVILTATP